MNGYLIYQAPVNVTKWRFSIQGSQFIGNLSPSVSEEIAQTIIESIRCEMPDASHHTFAYRIGIGTSLVERCFDDAEPSGTAGRPILQQLQANNVSDAVLVVTRYFGGTKLGRGGLARAYRESARKCLAEANLKEKEPTLRLLLTMSYEDLGAVSRLVDSLDGNMLNLEYSDRVTMKAEIPARNSDNLDVGFSSICRGRGSCEQLKKYTE